MATGHSNVISIPLTGGAPIQVLESNPDRIAIMFCNVAEDTVAYSPNPEPSSQRGITIGTAQRPYTLTLDIHGDIVTGPWYAFKSGGDTDVAMIVEVLKIKPVVDPASGRE